MPHFLDDLPDGLTGTPCRGVYDEPFVHERRDSIGKALDDEAKRICAYCPVRQACLDYALNAGEPHGIWGGLTPGERTELLRERARSAA
jgi:WhiB family redox-sensing transcriptional regulator